MRILMIGAHPDDCEFRCSGLAAKYVQDGHEVKFLSVSDGSGGHHEMAPADIAARRKKEIESAAAYMGIGYDVWDVPDCHVVADLETRARLVRYIREFSPDIIFSHRNNDYHTDHRNTALLVQDASYLLIVPNYCSDTPAMKETPVIMHYRDGFTNPIFKPDIVISIDDVIEKKFRMLDCHVSQLYEWLPFTQGKLAEVPADAEARYQWLKSDPVTSETTDEEILSGKLKGRPVSFALSSALYRDMLIERYGEEKGKRVIFSEAFAVSEYGAPLTEEKAKKLFPY